MLPAMSNTPSWGSGALISFQIPALFSAPIPSVLQVPTRDVHDSTFGGNQQQPDSGNDSLGSSSLLESCVATAGQLVPPLDLANGVGFSDKFEADSLVARLGSQEGWDCALSAEVPASSATNMFMPKNEINQIYLDAIASCLQSTASPCNDLAYSYAIESLQSLQSSGVPGLDLPKESIESLDCLISVTNSADMIEKERGMSPTAAEHNVNGSMKPMMLSASIPHTLSTSGASSESTQTQSNINIEDHSASQCSSDPIKQFKTKEGQTKSKPKAKARAKTKTKTYEDAQFRLQYSPSSSSSCLVFGQMDESAIEPDAEAIASMREMIYRAAAFRPVNLGTDVLEKPKRKNVKISSDPQTVAARQRRERISERIRILQRLVPGGSKMDTASMLDEAVNYLKFLKTQVKTLQSMGNNKADNIQNSINSYPFTSFDSQMYQNRLW